MENVPAQAGAGADGANANAQEPQASSTNTGAEGLSENSAPTSGHPLLAGCASTCAPHTAHGRGAAYHEVATADARDDES